MISREQISSKVKDAISYLLGELREFREEFIYCVHNARIASPLSLMSLLNNGKDKEQKALEVTKTFEPYAHLYKMVLQFPEDRNIYLECINSAPTGYKFLEPLDGVGYAIEDIDSYEGLITLVFYNETYVDVRGRLNTDTGEYMFNNPGVPSKFIMGSKSNLK